MACDWFKDAPTNQRIDRIEAMLTLRMVECDDMRKELDTKAKELSKRGSLFKNAIIILGGVVAAKEALDLAMVRMNAGRVETSMMSVAFLIIGLAVTIIATFDKTNRYEEKSGECKALAALCISYNREMMSDYAECIDLRNAAVTVAKLEALIDIMNDRLNNIRQRSLALGLDLSSVDVSYRI